MKSKNCSLSFLYKQLVLTEKKCLVAKNKNMQNIKIVPLQIKGTKCARFKISILTI